MTTIYKLNHILLVVFVLLLTVSKNSHAARTLTVDEISTTDQNGIPKTVFHPGDPIRYIVKFTISKNAFVFAYCSVKCCGSQVDVPGLQFQRIDSGQHMVAWDSIVTYGHQCDCTFSVSLIMPLFNYEHASSDFKVEEGDDIACDNGTSYVGTNTCTMCHAGINPDIIDAYQNSGHSFALNRVEENQPVVYPDFTAGVPNPPDGFAWDDLMYVTGGFAWSAIFVKNDGTIISNTADGIDSRYTLPSPYLGTDGGFVHYEPESQGTIQVRCAGCHTTGYIYSDDHSAIQWNEDGVGCEACHGPGSLHFANPSKCLPPLDPEESCQNCHVYDNSTVVEAAEGLILDRQQFEELEAGGMNFFKCTSCHDAHVSAHYKEDVSHTAIVAQCVDCHTDMTIGLGMQDLECEDCHMPYAVYAGYSEDYTDVVGEKLILGNMRSHIFSVNINADQAGAMFSDDGHRLLTDASGRSEGLTVDFVCQGCHRPGGSAQRAYSFEQLQTMAHTVHQQQQ